MARRPPAVGWAALFHHGTAMGESMQLTFMNAEKQSCRTKTALLVEWQNAAAAYATAVSEISKRIGKASSQEYSKLSHVAEVARNRSREARANLDIHIADHGCDNSVAIA
jgi:hypothetical protein